MTRVSRWERWASVVTCFAMMAASVGFCVGYVLYIAVLWDSGGVVAPPEWWYAATITASVIAGLMGGALGWDDPPWGGVTFSAREGYRRSS